MKFLCRFGLGLAFSIFSLGAAAQSFDGSKPLICASVETHDCEPGATCTKGLAEDIDAPQFIHLDFEQGIAHTSRATGEVQTAEIQSSIQQDGRLILQGVQLGLAWSMTIAEHDGAMALTVAGNERAFVIFGACEEES